MSILAALACCALSACLGALVMAALAARQAAMRDAYIAELLREADQPRVLTPIEGGSR